MSMMKLWIYIDRWLLRAGLNPIQGYALNPLRNYPRDLVCWCGSGAKAKDCCLPKQAKICTAKQAVILKRYMKYIEKHQEGGI